MSEKKMSDEEAKELIGMVAKAFASPISAMVELGAFPILVLAETDGGGIVALPTVAMTPQQVGKLLTDAAEAMKHAGNVTVKLLSEVTGKDDCGCPGCVARRADLGGAMAPPPDVPPMPPEMAKRPFISPAKPGVH